jgi:DNA-binding transcriptional LysR family regulator
MQISPLPPFNCLIAFEAVARHGSFTKAAAEMHLTQGAISRQITQLEGFLGRALFIREHRSIRLTIAGEQYASGVRFVLEQCAQTTQAVMKQRGNYELTVACSSGIASHWLVPRLPDFREKHSKIRFRLLVRDTLSSLTPAEFDVGIYYQRALSSPLFTGQYLFGAESYPVCAPGFLKTPIIRPHELIQHTLLMLEDVPRQWMSWQEWLRAHDTPLENDVVTIRANSYPILVQMAVAGQGIVLGTKHLINNMTDRGLLVRATSESVINDGAHYVLLPSERSATHSAQVFHDWLLAQVQSS